MNSLSPRCLISHFPTAKDYILIAFLSNDTRQCDCRTTVVNFIEPKMFDRSLSYDKRLHFDRFPSNDTRQYDCRTTVVNFIEPKMFDRSLSYDKRLHFDRFPSNETRQYYCRTTGVNLFEPKMFDRSLSYDKRLHFDRFPSNDTRQCDWRTTVVNLFEPKMCDLSLSFNKRLYFDRFSFERRTTMDNLIVERQLWTRSSPRFLISHFPTAKDYILIAFLSNDTRQFDCRTTVVNFIEPKMFDRSLSYDKRLHFDHFPSNDTRQYDWFWTLSSPRFWSRTTKDYILIAFLRTTQDNMIVERQLWTLSSPRCLIALFRTTKDYILIAFLRTTQDNMICRTTVVNLVRAQYVWSLTFVRQKTTFWSLSFERHKTILL